MWWSCIEYFPNPSSSTRINRLWYATDQVRYTFYVDTSRARYPTELSTVRNLFNLRIPRCLLSQVPSHFRQIRQALARNRIQPLSNRFPFTLLLGPTCAREGAVLPKNLACFLLSSWQKAEGRLLSPKSKLWMDLQIYCSGKFLDYWMMALHERWCRTHLAAHLLHVLGAAQLGRIPVMWSSGSRMLQPTLPPIYLNPPCYLHTLSNKFLPLVLGYHTQ